MLEWVLVACIGLCVGSFVAMMSVRIPNGENIFLPASHCVHCQTPLRFYHLVPILSFIFLKGKCAFCQSEISYRYPVTEWLVMTIALALFYRWGFMLDTIYLFVIFSLLVCASIIDVQYHAVSTHLLLVTLALTYLYLYQTQPHFMIALLDSLALAGAIALLGIFMESLTKRKGFGEGDVVVVAIVSGILGSKYGFIALFIASGTALWGFVNGYKGRIAFIPYLSIAAFMVLFWVSA